VPLSQHAEAKRKHRARHDGGAGLHDDEDDEAEPAGEVEVSRKVRSSSQVCRPSAC
jgi:hypothetical protein